MYLVAVVLVMERLPGVIMEVVSGTASGEKQVVALLR